jgi:hypothetical protein
MSIRIRLFTIAVIAFCLTGSYAPAQEITINVTARAKPGDVAIGVILEEKDGLLYLDTTPCKPLKEKQITQFVIPYTKKVYDPLACGSTKYYQYRIVQDQ